MSPEEFIEDWHNHNTAVKVKTSGSTGAPKEMMVEKSRMRASAKMTCDFLNLKSGDTAMLCMSVDYIAGKMMIVRAAERQLNLFSVTPSSHPLSSESLNNGHWLTGNTKNTPDSFDFAAMVPMQVYNTLQIPEERERLRNISHLIIGGGAIDDSLQKQLQDFPNNIWSTYGMTETLSHIAMRRINGEKVSLWYKTLPGVTIKTDENHCLIIDAPALCSEKLTTNDIVEMKNDTFRVLGRRDNVICSGGIKIQIEEVEARLRQYLGEKFAISRRKNQQFGEVVVLVSEGGEERELREICERVLPRYWQPKEYIHIGQIPRTETDKIARKQLEELIQ